MTDLDLKRLREVAQGATPGPWPKRHRECADLSIEDDPETYFESCGPRFDVPEDQFFGPASDVHRGQIRKDAEYISAFNPATALRLLDTIERQERALEVARDALTELQLGHEHNTNEGDHYRPLGDTYGWCHICSTKVGLNEDVVREALARIKEILG